MKLTGPQERLRHHASRAGLTEDSKAGRRLDGLEHVAFPAIQERT